MLTGLEGFLIYLLGFFTAPLLMLTIGRVYYNETPEDTLHYDSRGMFFTLLVSSSWVGVAFICIMFTFVHYLEHIKVDLRILVRERKWFWEE